MPERNTKTILLVEDDIIIAKYEALELEEYGYSVIVVHNGRDAVEECLSNNKIDLILMDINLGPGMDGTRAAEIILNEKDIPVVFLSSHTNPEIVERTEKITSYGYVVKNSGMTVLDASIKMAFKLFEAKQVERAKEEALRKSEEKYRLLFNTVQQAFAVHELIYNDYSADIPSKHGTPEGHVPVKRFMSFPVFESDRIVAVGAVANKVEPYDILDADSLLSIYERMWSIVRRKEAEERLLKSENKYRLLVEFLNEGIWQIDKDSITVYVNPRMAKMLGYTTEEMMGKHLFDFMDETGMKIAEENIARRQKGISENHDFEFIRKDGSRIYTHLETTPLINSDGIYGGALAAVIDVTRINSLIERQTLHHSILSIINKSTDSKTLIGEILREIKRFTSFEAVAIRLKEGDDYPYYVVNGFPSDFVEAERYLCFLDSDGNIERDAQGNPCLECMCGNIIRGRTDPSFDFFTEGGSFWSNNTSKLLSETSDEDRQARTRNRCNGEGYESVALIPIKSDGENIGLLQLNDSRTNRFTIDTIEFFEIICDSIGIAFKRIKQQEELEINEEALQKSLARSAS